MYYFVTGGGRAWVRRQSAAEIVETEQLRYPDAERLWERILLGHVK